MRSSLPTADRLSAARGRLLNAPGSSASAHSASLSAACAAVISSGELILGANVDGFEQELASWCGAHAAVGVANGTDALELSLRAADIGPGDQVITVSHTAGATLRAINRCGATPLLVDIDPLSYTIDVNQVAAAIAAFPAARAIVPVHLYGHPAALPELQQLAQDQGLALIEDCAQALGARCGPHAVGTFGHSAAFSFYPTKNLGALGDAGAILTSSEPTAQRLRCLRQYGWRERQYAESFGINSRLDEIQAAMLRVKLRHLKAEQRRRSELALRYQARLAQTNIVLPTSAAGMTHAWHLFVVRVPHRDAVQQWLAARGLPLSIHYPTPAHLQPAYCDAVRAASLEHTEQAAEQILSLPLHPQLLDDDIDLVCELLCAALDALT